MSVKSQAEQAARLTSEMTELSTDVRGPEAVRRSLIDAAKALSAVRSPRQVSGRELAQRAGVNYGLIHYYFGTKDNVFAQAVTEATETMAQRWDETGVLPLNTSDEAASYRTFAKLEVDESRSPITDLIARIVASEARTSGRPQTDSELLAEVAIVTALQFGWGTFEAEIVAALEKFGGELHALRARVAELSLQLKAD